MVYVAGLCKFIIYAFHLHSYPATVHIFQVMAHIALLIAPAFDVKHTTIYIIINWYIGFVFLVRPIARAAAKSTVCEKKEVLNIFGKDVQAICSSDELVGNKVCQEVKLVITSLGNAAYVGLIIYFSSHNFSITSTFTLGLILMILACILFMPDLTVIDSLQSPDRRDRTWAQGLFVLLMLCLYGVYYYLLVYINEMNYILYGVITAISIAHNVLVLKRQKDLDVAELWYD